MSISLKTTGAPRHRRRSPCGFQLLSAEQHIAAVGRIDLHVLIVDAAVSERVIVSHIGDVLIQFVQRGLSVSVGIRRHVARGANALGQPHGKIAASVVRS